MCERRVLCEMGAFNYRCVADLKHVTIYCIRFEAYIMVAVPAVIYIQQVQHAAVVRNVAAGTARSKYIPPAGWATNFGTCIFCIKNQ